MAKSSTQRSRECRQRKRARENGGVIETQISIDANDALIECGYREGKTEAEIIEWAILMLNKLSREESDMLKCWTMDELHKEKMLERQTRLGKRDKAALRGDDNTAEDGTALRIAQELLDLIHSAQPNFMGGAKITAKNWERSIQAMITVDFRDPAEMSAILKYVGDHDRFNIRTILGPRKFREQYDRLAIVYNDWVRKGAGVKKLTGKQSGKDSGVNPVNLKSAETILLEQKTAERLEKMRRIEEERSRLTSLTATPPQAEHETADTSTDSTTTPFHPHGKNSQAVRKIRDFLGSFDQTPNPN